MKLNGRFAPFEEERNENNPEQDFPIQEKALDFEGKERAFEITNYAVGLGFIVQAVEQGKEEVQRGSEGGGAGRDRGEVRGL